MSIVRLRPLLINVTYLVPSDVHHPGYCRSVFRPADIRAVVARLRAAASARSIFGASGHGFELNGPISERELVGWERGHGIELPADYRAYLSELGNGGAGPYYGSFPLGCGTAQVAISNPSMILLETLLLRFRITTRATYRPIGSNSRSSRTTMRRMRGM